MSDQDNRANQKKPNNPEFNAGRGFTETPSAENRSADCEGTSEDKVSQFAVDNRANQMNPNNNAYSNAKEKIPKNKNWSVFGQVFIV